LYLFYERSGANSKCPFPATSNFCTSTGSYIVYDGRLIGGHSGAQEDVVMEYIWKLLAAWLNGFNEGSEVLKVLGDTPALILRSTEWWPFETCHSHIGECHMLPTVAHNSDILCFPWCLSVNLESYWMEHTCNSVEQLEMAAVKVGNYTQAVDGTDGCVSEMDCLCIRQLVNDQLMIGHCCQGIVVSEPGHRV